MSTPKSEMAEAKSIDTPADRIEELAAQSTALARIVARNESALPELLEELSRHSDATVRKWVCVHTNTPPEVLGELGGQFPQQLMDNPALDFMILENPNLLREFPLVAKTSMLKRQTCPASFIELMAQDMENQEGMQLAIAMNQNTPAHVIRKLKKSYIPKVKEAALQHIHAGGTKKGEAALRKAVHEDLARGFEIEQWMPWAVVAGFEQPGVPERGVLREMLQKKILTNAKKVNPLIESRRKLAQDRDPGIRIAAVRNPNTTSETLRQIALGNIDSVHKILAKHPGFPADVLQRLSQSGEKNIRKAVAKNPHTPAKALEQLAQDKARFGDYPTTPDIRIAIAKNPSTPIETLKRLAEDKEKDWEGRYTVRQAVVSNRIFPKKSKMADLIVIKVAMAVHTHVEVLQQLVNYKSDEVRTAVAENPSTPADVLSKLAQDKSEHVRSAAVTNLNTSEKVQKHIFIRWTEEAEGSQDDSLLLQSDEYVPFLASLPFFPARSYGAYARHADPVVRAALASNPLAPTALLKKLADDSEEGVRLALAKNSWADPAIYTRLSNDPVPKVRAAVARQPSLSHEQQLVVAADGQPVVRLSLARNRNCHVEVLCLLANNEKSSVRKAVAASPQLTKSLIEQMSGDVDARVRERLWKRTDLPIPIRELLNEEFGKRPMKKRKLSGPPKPQSLKPATLKQDKSLLDYLEGDKLLLETGRTFKTFFDYNVLSARLLKIYETLPAEQRAKLFDAMSAEQKQQLPRKIARSYAATQWRNTKIQGRKSKPIFNRLLSLMLDDCPTPIIAKAVRSNDWLERLAIATHPKAPASTLKILCNDGNKWVRQAAEQAVQQQEQAA